MAIVYGNPGRPWPHLPPAADANVMRYDRALALIFYCLINSALDSNNDFTVRCVLSVSVNATGFKYWILICINDKQAIQ